MGGVSTIALLLLANSFYKVSGIESSGLTYEYDYDYGEEETESKEKENSAGGANFSKYSLNIETEEKTIQVAAGTTIRLPCKVDNLPKEVWQNLFWSRLDSSKTIIATGERVLGEWRGRARVTVTEQGSSLVITLAREQDAGKYKCRVALDTDNSREVVHTVIITGEQIIDTKSPEQIAISQGDDLTLSCNTSSTTKVSWNREGKALPRGLTSFEGNVFTLSSIQAEEAGIYVCRAEDEQGREATGEITVDVLHPPKVSVTEVVVEALSGSLAELVCKVTGHPKPSVTWYKDGKKLAKGDEKRKISARGERHTLIIASLLEEDQGLYVCTAENSEGSKSGEMRLKAQVTAKDEAWNPAMGASLSLVASLVSLHLL